MDEDHLENQTTAFYSGILWYLDNTEKVLEIVTIIGNIKFFRVLS